MDKAALKDLQNKNAADVIAAVPSLERADVCEVLALEAFCNSPRVTVTQACATRLEQIDADDAAEPVADTAAPGTPPAHHHPDYAGPLTIEQADWRNEHIKPVAKAVKTK